MTTYEMEKFFHEIFADDMFDDECKVYENPFFGWTITQDSETDMETGGAWYTLHDLDGDPIEDVYLTPKGALVYFVGFSEALLAVGALPEVKYPDGMED